MTRVEKYLAVLDAVVEAIALTGDEGIPSGHLYAMLMDKMSLETYQTMIEVLVRAGKITESHNLLLRATGGRRR